MGTEKGDCNIKRGWTLKKKQRGVSFNNMNFAQKKNSINKTVKIITVLCLVKYNVV